MALASLSWAGGSSGPDFFLRDDYLHVTRGHEEEKSRLRHEI